MTQLLVRPIAAAEIEDTYRWYNSQRAGLGEESLAAVDALLRDIGAHPSRYPVIYREARRALLRRFPYAIFYRI